MMAVDVRIPVPLDELIVLLAPARALKPGYGSLLSRAAILQGARSETIGFYLDGRLIAAITLYPLDPERPREDLREASFACLPEASAHMTGVIRHARLIRLRLAEHADVRIRATVLKGHEPGRRIARLIGLRPAGETGAFELWEWTPADEVRHVEIRELHHVADHRRGK
jgi:hypothetical protein